MLLPIDPKKKKKKNKNVAARELTKFLKTIDDYIYGFT